MPGQLELSLGMGRYTRRGDNPLTQRTEEALVHYVPVGLTLGLLDQLALRLQATAVDVHHHETGDHDHDDDDDHGGEGASSDRGLGDVTLSLVSEVRPGEGDDGPLRLRFKGGASLPVGNVRNPMSGDLNFSTGSIDALTGAEAAFRIAPTAEIFARVDLRTVLAFPGDGLRTGSSLRTGAGVRSVWMDGSLGLGLGLSHVRRAPDLRVNGVVGNSGGDWIYLGPSASWRFSGPLSGLGVWLAGSLPLHQDARSDGDEFQLKDIYMLVGGLSWSVEVWEHEHEEDSDDDGHGDGHEQPAQSPQPTSQPTSQPAADGHDHGHDHAAKPAGAAAGVDIITVVEDGSDREPSEHLAKGRFTVVDFYAPWCKPCKTLEEKLVKLAAGRSDLAIRRFGFNEWEDPLAKRWIAGGKLPYIQIYGPKGEKLAEAAGSVDACLKAVEQALR